MLFALLGSVLVFALWLLIPVAIVVLLLYVRIRRQLARKRAERDVPQHQTYHQDGRYIEGEFIDESGHDENQQTP